MESREQERKRLCERIEQLEQQDKAIRDTISKEKLQYDMVAARDSLIEDISKRYEQMREDFKYNLNLIAQRDSEINRLNVVINTHKNDYERLENEKRQLSTKIGDMEISIFELNDTYNKEKSQHQRLLNELKEEIQDIHLATSEEIRAKDKEIERLRQDLKISANSRAEAIDHQRADLVETYEQLMKQKEDVHSAREKEVSDMIGHLEQRFDMLQNEALELKNELNEKNIKYEHVANDLSKKTEQLRMLQHKYDDEMAETSSFMEQATKKIYDLQAAAKDRTYEHNTVINGHVQEIDKLKQELKNSHSKQEETQASFDEYHHFVESERQKVEQHHKSALDRYDSLLQQEKHKSEEANANVLELSSQILELDRVNSSLQHANSSLKHEVENLTMQYKHVSEQLSDARDMVSQLHISRDQEKAMCDRQIVELKESHSKALMETVAELQAAKKHDINLLMQTSDNNSSLRLKDLQNDFEKQILEKKEEYKRLEAKLEESRLETADMKKLYEEQKSEVSVLKLRLQAMQITSETRDEGHRRDRRGASQDETGRGFGWSGNYNTPGSALPKSGSELSPLHIHTHSHADDGGHDGGNHEQNNLHVNNSGYLSQLSTFDKSTLPSIPPMTGTSLDSPMFSNSVDYAHLNMEVEQTNHNNRHAVNTSLDSQGLSSVFPPAPPLDTPLRSDANTQDTGNAHGNLMGIMNENESLRQIVKEMRNEVESLQKQMSNQSVDMPLSSPNGRGDSKISSMETRLLQATNEINKLQKERRRLMDISNTLHSQLYQQGQYVAQVAEEQKLQQQLLLSPDHTPSNAHVPTSGQSQHTVGSRSAGSGGSVSDYHMQISGVSTPTVPRSQLHPQPRLLPGSVNRRGSTGSMPSASNPSRRSIIGVSNPKLKSGANGPSSKPKTRPNIIRNYALGDV